MTSLCTCTCPSLCISSALPWHRTSIFHCAVDLSHGFLHGDVYCENVNSVKFYFVDVNTVPSTLVTRAEVTVSS